MRRKEELVWVSIGLFIIIIQFIADAIATYWHVILCFVVLVPTVKYSPCIIRYIRKSLYFSSNEFKTRLKEIYALP